MWPDELAIYPWSIEYRGQLFAFWLNKSQVYGGNIGILNSIFESQLVDRHLKNQKDNQSPCGRKSFCEGKLVFHTTHREPESLIGKIAKGISKIMRLII